MSARLKRREFITLLGGGTTSIVPPIWEAARPGRANSELRKRSRGQSDRHAAARRVVALIMVNQAWPKSQVREL
jgi:hypothetical protein